MTKQDLLHDVRRIFMRIIAWGAIFLIFAIASADYNASHSASFTVTPPTTFTHNGR